jgi:hypothetical protein
MQFQSHIVKFYIRLAIFIEVFVKGLGFSRAAWIDKDAGFS